MDRLTIAENFMVISKFKAPQSCTTARANVRRNPNNWQGILLILWELLNVPGMTNFIFGWRGCHQLPLCSRLSNVSLWWHPQSASKRLWRKDFCSNIGTGRFHSRWTFFSLLSLCVDTYSILLQTFDWAARKIRIIFFWLHRSIQDRQRHSRLSLIWRSFLDVNISHSIWRVALGSLISTCFCWWWCFLSRLRGLWGSLWGTLHIIDRIRTHTDAKTE